MAESNEVVESNLIQPSGKELSLEGEAQPLLDEEAQLLLDDEAQPLLGSGSQPLLGGESLLNNEEAISNTNLGESASNGDFADAEILQETSEIQTVIQDENQAADVIKTSATAVLTNNSNSGFIERDGVEVIATTIFRTGGVNTTVNIVPQPISTALLTDISVSPPTITIAGDTNTNGVYDLAELGGDGTVTATIAIPTDAVAGDIVTYQVNSETAVSVTLTTVNIASGIGVEIPPLAVITAKITDGAGNTSTNGTATALAPDITAPVAVDDAINTTEDTVFTSSIDLAANDTDLDGDSLTVTAGTFTTAQGGTLALAADGS
ncbi:hypothetical protein H4J59_01265, partial [Colwellia sp. MB02u-10]|uniref:Ig-like domain-containing protein n=1 Tax=Colwellia sp. MB02u-10 TaxID=2759828 RepID=UPI0015F39AFA